MNVLAFNIETIPDVDSGRKLYELQGLADKDVLNVMLHKCRQEAGHERLPLHLQKILTLSMVQRCGDDFSLTTFCSEKTDEKAILESFFSILDKQNPILVSWNGARVALPVLHYRSLLYGVKTPLYWDQHEQIHHIDLMEVLAEEEVSAHAPLYDIATMLGLPAFMGTSSIDILDEYLLGNIDDLTECGDVDGINTYLIYLRYEMTRGHLSSAQYESECERVRASLQSQNKLYLTRFIQHWQ